MGLSQFFRSVDLSIYPQIALVIFLGVFGAVTVRAWSRRQEGANAEAARLPLDEAPRATHRSTP